MKKDYFILIAGLALLGLIVLSFEPSYTGYATATTSGSSINLLNFVKNYGVSQEFSGNVKASFRDMDSDGILRLSLSDGQSANISVKDLKCIADNTLGNSCGGSEIKYNISTNSFSVAPMNITKDSLITNYAIYLLNTPESIKRFELYLSSNVSGVISPMVYVNDIDLWKYRGPLEKLNGGYFNFIESLQGLENIEITDLTQIIPKTDNIGYCQPIKLFPSNLFKFEFLAKKENGKNDFIRIMLEDKNNEIIQNISGHDAECYTTIRETGFTSCVINMSIAKEDDYFICVNGIGGSYSLGAYGSSNPRGVQCDLSTNQCGSSSLDYYFKTYYANFSTNLVNSALINLTEGFNDTINEFIDKCPFKFVDGQTTKCLIPLTFKSESDGLLKIDGLNFKYSKSGTDYTINTLKNINLIPSHLVNGTYNLDLKNSGLIIPSIAGNYTVNIELWYKGNIIASNSTIINIFNKPTAVITSSFFGGLGEVLSFDGFKSNASENTTIKSYQWIFGDGESATGINVTHIYKKNGAFYVNLTVIDSNDMKSDVITRAIQIGSVQENVAALLNDTEYSVNHLAEKISSNTDSNIAEVIEILNLNSQVENYKKNISDIKNSYNNIMTIYTSNLSKEIALSNLQNVLSVIREDIPKNLEVNTLEGPIFISKEDIPEELLTKVSGNKESYKDQLLLYQSSTTTKAKIYGVKLERVSGNQEFRIVSKEVSSTKRGYAYEIIPKSIISSIKAEDIITEEYSIVKADPIIKYPISGDIKFSYKLPFGNINDALAIKTIIIPDELKIVEEEPTESCNNDGICNRPFEDELGCPGDCIKKPIPWVTYIILTIILIIGIYYFNVYKGPGNFDQLMRMIFKKKSPFKGENDLRGLINFIKMSKGRMNEQQIKEILKKKGWTDEQIAYAFKLL